jgi:hypothetical protein
VLLPPLASMAESWPLSAFPDPAPLRPSLAVVAVDVPAELAPPLAVSAVPVPPPLGVATGADAPEAPPCVPAWLLPSLATLEMAAPLSSPLRFVVCARAEMRRGLSRRCPGDKELPARGLSRR